jgi:rhodanese-related sulfurtransferase
MILLLIIFILVLLFIFKNKGRLTPEEFVEKINNKDYDYILDVRTQKEWNEGHHPSATLIPIGEFVSELPKQVKNKDAKLLIYCKRGIRAEASAKIAERLGYTNVYWLDGTYGELSKLI